MYSIRKLSDNELDAIEIYKHFKHKSVQVIAKEVQLPTWCIENIVFKYLNGCVVGGMLVRKNLKAPYKQPRKGLNPTQAALQIAMQETANSDLKLRTITTKG